MDYTHDVQGVMHTHGSPIRMCHELLFVSHITSVGIRTARRKPYEESQKDGNLVITTKRFHQIGPRAVVDLIPKGENLYITLDIDVMDPSQAPGTGTPETGGLGYHETRECLVALVDKCNLVGFDLVEVAPPYDSSEITVQVAASLIIDILAARFPST
jgi:agmatinase